MWDSEIMLFYVYVYVYIYSYYYLIISLSIQLYIDYIPYVAPEVSMLLASPDDVKEEDYFYSDAIDWWCLGILLYRLLVGKYPFKVLSMQQIQSILPETVQRCDGDIGFAFTTVFGEVDYQTYSEYLTADAIDLVSGLLEINIVERLGVTTMTRDDCAAEEGISAHSLLKKHHFFDDIDINLLENNELLPPYCFDDDGIINIAKNNATSYVSSPAGGGSPKPARPTSASSVASGDGSYGSSLVPELNAAKWYSFHEILSSCDKQSWVPEEYTKSSKHKTEEDLNGSNGNGNGGNGTNNLNLFEISEREKDKLGITSTTHVPASINISKKDQLYFMDWNFVSQAVIQQEGDIFKAKPGKETKYITIDSTIINTNFVLREIEYKHI